MNAQQWKTICDKVADGMLLHTRPFVTPLGTEDDRSVRLVGTGSYVARENRRFVLTCEHVARVQPMHYRLYGNDDVFEHHGPWIMERHPVDAAFAPISELAWAACSPRAQFSAENARYAFGVHQTNGSGYATEEKENSGDAQIFELFWEPQKTQFTSQTTPEATAEMKFEDAGGFSGSLVWNTRYLEVTQQGGQWTPEDSVVTGLLRRWDTATKTLLAWRVEHLRAWLEAKGA